MSSSQLAVLMTEPTAQKARLSPLGWISLLAGIVVVAILIHYNVTHEAHAGEHDVHPELPPLWGLGVLPFVGLLLSIAALPLIPAAYHWWEYNANRFCVAIGCAGLTLIYYLFAKGADSILPVLNHAIPGEYIPFIVLLFALYVISGGICLKGDLAAHPMTNTGFLAVGALIASFVGTTGASMLLIRPLLQTNHERKHVVHTVVFFIFLVSNIGGTLLPIGDPPLFLGYLKGVDFFWTLNLWVEWAVACSILLVAYFVLDNYYYRKESPEAIRLDDTDRHPLRLFGSLNIVWLFGVVAAVAFLVPGEPLFGTSLTVFPFMRELLMLGFVGLSLITTRKSIREANDFNYAAIIEVAALFVGIFICMQVPLEVLGLKGASLGLSEPWHFFWATGFLSGVLDNAPTYVVFFETANALDSTVHPKTIVRPDLLVGISLGAVFMGAMTYIGNGPNFMVKAIAEQAGIRMPSFFGYLFRYALVFLLPTFIIVSFILPKADPAELPAAVETPAAHVQAAPPATHEIDH